MKPLLLEIEAFGPYGGEVSVDFTQLEGDGLFLIHGRTGSGKTSLLDAICFALYGEVPGARHQATRSLRSHHADRGATPRVRLEFEAQGSRYRVDRTPPWDAPKLRGAGVTPKAATAVLVRLHDGGEHPVAQKVTEVNREIRDLIGLTASQFLQVILLPQGRFEKVLQADSAEREKLFETLFDTQVFKAAQEWLETQAKQRGMELGRARTEVRQIAEEAARRAAAVLDPETVDAVLGEVPEDGVAPSSGPDEIDALVAAVGRRVEQRQNELQAVEQAEDTARALHAQAAATAERQARRAELRAELASLEQLADEIGRQRLLLEAATSAEVLRPSLDDVARRTAVVERDRKAVAADLARAREAREAVATTVEGLADLDLRSVPSGDRLSEACRAVTARQSALEALAVHARTAEQAEAAHVVAQQLADDAAKVAAEARERTAGLSEQLPGVEAALTSARAAAERLPGLRSDAVQTRSRADAAARLARHRPEVQAAEAAHRDAADAAQAAKARHLEHWARYLDGMAAHLAGRLELDPACAVCGSHDHPEPAQPAPDAVTIEEVERRQAEAEQAEEKRDLAMRGLEAKRNREAELRGAAGPVADDPDEAERLAACAARALAEAEGLVADLESLRAEHANLTRVIAADEKHAQMADVTAATKSAEARSHLHRAAEARAALAEQLGSDLDLDTAQASLTELLTALTAVAEHAASAREARAALEAAHERLSDDLSTSPFADRAEASAALLDDETRTDLRRRIDRHEGNTQRIKTHLASPELASLPDEAPDVAGLAEGLERAEVATAEAQRQVALAVDALDAVTGLARRHRSQAEALSQAETEVNLYQAVAARCCGQVAPKVALQRWVLGTYLQEVCRHANRRLATMTAGRYQLRVERTATRANAQAGLDLRVHDANTNQEREVSTLSGGETFQASLALALGVADSVEAHAGGVRLEVLFVDEGFGSLDPESLELALDELDGLRAGGRTVGLISHVGSLRERIRTGVEVTTGPGGSTVRVGEIANV